MRETGRATAPRRRARGGLGRAGLALGLLACLVAPAPAPVVGAGTPVPAPGASQAGDGRLDLTGLYHDSRDGEYRTPGGAVPAGTTVTLRLRTLHDDATDVELRLTDASGTRAVAMQRVAAAVACGAPAPDTGAAATCDLWASELPTTTPAVLTYSFEVHDGSATAYVSDDQRGDGGPGQAALYKAGVDWVVSAYQPGFAPIPWLQDAVVYQIFPDRFANGEPANDANVDQPRYSYPPDPLARIERRAWGTAPEQPARGRDYFGGDLAGIRQHLPYLHDLGVTVLYLNPIFTAASNHGYDTVDYLTVDPRFGTGADWRALVAAAHGLGMRVILDGVFDHVSSDSPWFDRYGHFPQVGACESVDSPYRDWFFFRPQANGPCAGPDGPHTMTYTAWSGYDTLAVLNKRNPQVQQLIYAGNDSVARHWLADGAAGWRLDTMSDGSFPAGFWQAFRAAVKAQQPDAPIVAEAWKREEVLPLILGDEADTTMDYRFRNAVLAYLGTADVNGLPDDGTSELAPSIVASKLAGILEDEAPAAAAMAFHLVDSHDTERVLWSLTPGATSAEKTSPAGLAVGKARLRLATLMQFTMPGAPVIYYGDEVGMTGADDPLDRGTYPTSGGDTALAAWYRSLAADRAANEVLVRGDLRFLLTDDTSRTLVYARSEPGSQAVVAIHPDPSGPLQLAIPTAQPLDGGTPIRDGIRFRDLLTGTEVVTAGGELRVTVPASGGALLVAEPGQDLTPPGAPTGLAAVRSAPGVTLHWTAPADAARYEVLRAPVSGGGYVAVGGGTGTSLVDAAAPAGEVHYVVRALDASGNVGPASADVRLASSLGPSASPSSPPQGSTTAAGATPLAVVGLVALGLLVLVAAGWISADRRRRAGR